MQYADESLYDLEELKQEIKKINYNNLIISDELFSGIPEQNYLNRSIIANRLSAIFPNAEILLFIRGQKDILVSLYNQALKIGSTDKTIDKYIWLPTKEYTYDMYCQKAGWNKNTRYYNHLDKNIHPSHFFYYELIELYNKLFKKVHVFLYEDFIANSQQIIQQIQEIIGDTLVNNNKNIFSNVTNPKIAENKMRIQRYENRLKKLLLTKNKYILRLSAWAYGAFYYPQKKHELNQSPEEYVSKLTKDYYLENNRKIIKYYPHIPLKKYPNSYQF